MPPRRGLALIVVLMFLGVAGLFLSGWLLAANYGRQQLRLTEQRAQARWLIEAAIERGAAALYRDAEYAGENWAVSSAELGGLCDAAVTIASETVDTPIRRRLNISLQLKAGDETLVEGKKQILLDLPGEESP